MESEPTPMGLVDLPAELRQYVGHYLDEARDVAACILAHPRLLARPLLYWLGRMRPLISIGDVLEASAPLDIVLGLFAQWRVEPLPAMVVGATIGGRVDVLRWLLCRLDAASLVDCEICQLSSRSGPSGCPSSPDDTDSDTDTAPSSTTLGDCLMSDANGACNRGARPHGADSDDDNDHADDNDGDDDNGRAIVYYGGVLVSALRKAAEHDRAEVLTCLLTQAPPPGRVPSPYLLGTIAIDAAARGSLGILAALHEWRLEKGRGVCGCPVRVGREAMRADHAGVLDWLAAAACTGALTLDQATLDDVPSHPLPHFARWAVSRLLPHVRVGPERLGQLAASDSVSALKVLHETGLGVCSKEMLRVAAARGSMDVLKWAAGDSPCALPLAAWNPIDAAVHAAASGRKDVIRWLTTRPDADRVLTAGVARLALSHGFVKTAAAVRPLDQWDALAVVVPHKDLPEIAAVVHHGARCTSEAMAAAMRRRDERILELLCRKYGTAMVPDAIESAAGTRCSLNCIRWLSDAVLCGEVPDSVCVAHLWASAAVDWPDGAQSCCMCLRCRPRDRKN
ncbi:hypothetical protein pdul_cds_205 [Pandoravirus dulcis]|uniref:Ankyrin repeat domain containing protein n=1 Tax=Pandoravirus dulcis TaxID=1349409 RepID=A0A291AU14_9VIRU|nr:hypothetical protein pdul_cds_205 [Pandoravirus dulcis]ATE82474.1 hypothetical protein pdul_cds_205 [Pandoravirus dulcis]